MRAKVNHYLTHQDVALTSHFGLTFFNGTISMPTDLFLAVLDFARAQGPDTKTREAQEQDNG